MVGSPETYHAAGLRWGTATSNSTKTGTTSNYQIRINRDEAEATTKVRVIHIGAGERAGLTPYESIGVYEDLLRRTPEGWRIVHRRFDVQISIGDIAILGLSLSQDHPPTVGG